MKNVAYKVVKMEEQVMENIYFSGGNPPSRPSESFPVHNTSVVFECAALNTYFGVKAFQTAVLGELG